MKFDKKAKKDAEDLDPASETVLKDTMQREIRKTISKRLSEKDEIVIRTFKGFMSDNDSPGFGKNK